MLGASFDIGYRTFTSCLFRVAGNELQVLHWCKKDFLRPPWQKVKGDRRARQAERTRQAEPFVADFFQYLARLFQLWSRLGQGQDIRRLLIETQLRQNRKAHFLQCKLKLFVRFVNAGLVPSVHLAVGAVTLLPANVKRSVFSEADLARIQPGQSGYRARKQAAVNATLARLPSDFPQRLVDPDLADSLVQALAFMGNKAR
jgi:hypothetical protein